MIGAHIDDINLMVNGILGNGIKLYALEHLAHQTVSIVSDNNAVHQASFALRLVHITQMRISATGLKGFQLVGYFLADAVAWVETVKDEKQNLHVAKVRNYL